MDVWAQTPNSWAVVKVGRPQHMGHHAEERTVCYGLDYVPLPQNSYPQVLMTHSLKMGLYLEKRISRT